MPSVPLHTTSSDSSRAIGPGLGNVRNDESDLIEAARKDPAAFGPLYRRHAPAIERYLRRRLGDPHLVEDALAETFVQALRGIHRYEARGLPFQSWLYRIANSRVHRSRRRQALTHLEHIDADVVDAAHSSHDVAESREDAAIARIALLRVTPKFQAAMALHYLEGLPVAEVARVLDCRVGTIKSRLARGRVAMKLELERMGWTR